MSVTCPKCEADVSDSFENAGPSVGIMSSGYYCDACDLPIAEEDYEPSPDDVPLGPLPRDPSQPLGTPISMLSGQPGDPRNPDDPRHAGYERFKQIAKSWGYD